MVLSNSQEAWIETFTGKRFPLLKPDPDLVCIDDIAHALSCQGRWTGHTKYFYSVAQHSCYVSWLSEPADALWGLLHDASEAYLADLSRPVKHCTPIGEPYREIEAQLMRAIVQHFGLSGSQPMSVKKADNYMLWEERRQLMSGAVWRNPGDWDVKPEERPMPHIHVPPISFLSPRDAEIVFLRDFRRLVADECRSRVRDVINILEEEKR